MLINIYGRICRLFTQINNNKLCPALPKMTLLLIFLQVWNSFSSFSSVTMKKNKVVSKSSLMVGIPNLESICYMSSVLQVLANIKSYHEVILIIPTESSFDSDKILALQLMLTALLNQVGEDEISLCMSNFCKIWKKNINDEGDCAEFLMEILSSLEDYLKNTVLEESFERLVYSTGEAGGKESFIYLNPGGQDTKLEQVITRFSSALS